ncbi:hypothetical protein SADUNF_Sadunf15G0090200 [Salix dunnii]|uniref:Uncharacterized protein n=1 Tax=Salix dunnii TaxID=1413687 RepID=A0A835JGI7_9ROSI|nr:hypothetical protein SADUNF_Sadunf15G0090200 [Salix dunnii]
MVNSEAKFSQNQPENSKTFHWSTGFLQDCGNWILVVRIMDYDYQQAQCKKDKLKTHKQALAKSSKLSPVSLYLCMSVAPTRLDLDRFDQITKNMKG